MYSTGIDRKAGSGFRRRSRQKGAMDRLEAAMRSGREYTDAQRGRMTTEYSALNKRIG